MARVVVWWQRARRPVMVGAVALLLLCPLALALRPGPLLSLNIYCLMGLAAVAGLAGLFTSTRGGGRASVAPTEPTLRRARPRRAWGRGGPGIDWFSVLFYSAILLGILLVGGIVGVLQGA